MKEVALLILAGSCALGSPIEEIPIAQGPPSFGEQPWIMGNLIVWRRYAANSKDDTIQCRDISRLDTPVIDVARYPASSSGVILGPYYLFRGASAGFLDGSAILARRIEDFEAREGRDTLVNHFGRAVAATKDYVFIKVDSYEQKPYNSKIFVKRLPDDLADPSPDALRLITEFRDGTDISRSEAASDRYFVWQDHDPNSPSDTWKIYARKIDQLFTPGGEHVIDTKKNDTVGVYLDLHDNLLVYEGFVEDSGTQGEAVYLLNLDDGGSPITLATAWAGQPYYMINWPSISGEYVVWTLLKDVFERTPYAQRLVDGKPVGEPFPLSSAQSAGSWITIDGNIAVWNGATTFNGDFVHQAIIAAELPRPGAGDVGDVDQNGRVNLTDAVIILSYLFHGSWQPRLRLADADLNAKIGLTDVIIILEYLFLGGKRPGQP